MVQPVSSAAAQQPVDQLLRLLTDLLDWAAATRRAFLAERPSKIEMPKIIEFRDGLPKTMIGKLSKKDLVDAEGGKGPR